MGLIKGKLGQYIELREIRNTDLKYGAAYARGVNTSKKMMPTKADLNGRDLSKFQIVAPGEFFFNHRTSRNGSKFSITYNNTESDIICTEDYVVFRISDYGKQYVLPEWLYMYFNRPEFDRYVITNSWGSSTEFYNWVDLCDVDMKLPPLHIQQKYVAIYKAMLANQQSYECGLEDLKLVCDGFIDQLKKKYPLISIGNFIASTDNRNFANKPYSFKGLSMENYFIDSIADDTGLDFSKYKIVEPNELACVLMKVGRDCRLTVAKNESNDTYIISPAYYTFKLKDINPDYFMINVNRLEFERRAWFSCDSSARGSLSWSEFCDLQIPNAPFFEQKIISNLYKSYKMRFQINERLKIQIKDICPILIKGAVEEGARI